MSTSKLGNQTTASERLFEEYLTDHGYTEWKHEQPIPGKRTTPDYRIRFGDLEFCFEIKEFVNDIPVQDDGAPGFYDPYRPLREKVNQAARQFKAYKEFPCSVVMADPHCTFVDIDAPEIVIGTMLGNIGYEMAIGEKPGSQNQPKQVFTTGGKMVDTKGQRVQNTTISAIVILSKYPVRQRRLEIAIEKRAKQFGRKLAEDEYQSVFASVPSGKDDSALRVVVYENPYARIPLRRDLFRGPFDERWGTDGQELRRVFVGADLTQLEQELAESDRRSPIQRLIDRQKGI